METKFGDMVEFKTPKEIQIEAKETAKKKRFYFCDYVALIENWEKEALKTQFLSHLK